MRGGVVRTSWVPSLAVFTLEDELLLFDDTDEHFAVNDGPSARTVLHLAFAAAPVGKRGR